jgi:hypothetical protein
MKNKIETWIAELRSITGLFLKEFGELTTEELNRKPGPGRWSIAQNIDHLIKTNETYYPVFKDLHDGNYQRSFSAHIPFLPAFFGSLILKTVKPDRKMKGKTFPVWEPSHREADAGILVRFQNHQQVLASQIEKSQPFMEKGSIIHSPANRFIVYKLETAFDIIISHEKRHFNQALEVKNRGSVIQ